MSHWHRSRAARNKWETLQRQRLDLFLPIWSDQEGPFPSHLIRRFGIAKLLEHIWVAQHLFDGGFMSIGAVPSNELRFVFDDNPILSVFDHHLNCSFVHVLVLQQNETKCSSSDRRERVRDYIQSRLWRTPGRPKWHICRLREDTHCTGTSFSDQKQSKWYILSKSMCRKMARMIRS